MGDYVGQEFWSRGASRRCQSNSKRSARDPPGKSTFRQRVIAHCARVEARLLKPPSWSQQYNAHLVSNQSIGFCATGMTRTVQGTKVLYARADAIAKKDDIAMAELRQVLHSGGSASLSQSFQGLIMAGAQKARLLNSQHCAAPAPIIHQCLAEDVLPHTLNDQSFSLRRLGHGSRLGLELAERFDGQSASEPPDFANKVMQ